MSSPEFHNRTLLRVCLWEIELITIWKSTKQCAKIMEYTCRGIAVTPYYFANSTVKTPLTLSLLLLFLSILIYRSFFMGDQSVDDQHQQEGPQSRRYLVLHKANRQCLDRQAVDTVCHTLEDMVTDSMKGLSYREIWAYEVVHLQKLRELGYKLLEFLDDLKRDTRDSHNLSPTQVLTEVAMTLVLEREVRCITSLDKEVEQSFDACGGQGASDQVDNKAIERMYDLLEHTRMAS